MPRGEALTVVIDSNEYVVGNHWHFPEHKTVVKSLLKYGCDYAIRGQLGIVGVERKSHSDYVRCCGKGWPAFKKQLAKLQRNKRYCVVVEGHIDDIIYYKSRMTLTSVAVQTANIVSRGIPVVFAGSRRRASYICIHFLVEALRSIREG